MSYNRNNSTVFLLILICYINLNCTEIDYKRISASNNLIYVLSDNEIIMAGENGKLIKTKNKGEDWKWIESGSRNSFKSINFNNDGKGVLNTSSEIFITVDRGENWTRIIDVSDSSITKSFINYNQEVIYSKGNDLLKLSLINHNTDTIITTSEPITDFFVKDSLLFISTYQHFYKLSKEIQVLKTFVKGKYNSKINTFSVNNDYVLIGGTDTSGGKFSNFLLKSTNGGISFDSVIYNQIGYVNKILFYKEHFVVINNWGYLFHYSKNFDFFKSDTIKPINYLKFTKDFIIVKDIFNYNDNLYFCGRDQSYGYEIFNGLKLVKYASSQYLVPVYTVNLNNIISLNDKLYIMGNLGRIFMSKDKGISWNTIFPVDTISDTPQTSPWNDYRDENVNFFGSFKYKNGLRFVGINKYTKPLDIYFDTLTNTFSNLNQIMTSILLQDSNNVLYLQNTSIFYSTDGGANFNSIPFPDSLLKAQNKSITYFNPIQKITRLNENQYLILKIAHLNKNDTVNNPQNDEAELIFYIFNIKNNDLEVRKILRLGNEFTYNFGIIPNNHYIIYGYGFSKKIIIIDSSFNELKSFYLKFNPTNIHVDSNNIWLATTQKDSLYISIDQGNTWSFKNLSNDTTLYENQSVTFSKIFNSSENKYILIGPNRITLISLKNINDWVENFTKKEKLFFIFPNPVTEFINISIINGKENPSVDNVEIYNIMGEKILTTPSYTIPPLQTDGELKIDISDFKPGVYFVKAGNIIQKFIKL